MTPLENIILPVAKNWVTSIFQNQVSPSFSFHNLEHTQGVVKACAEMADYYKLNEEDRVSVLLAGWFHDTGYSNGFANNHEDASLTIARQFMERQNLPESVQQKTLGCINATRVPQKPGNLPEQIVCDADLFHLGTDDFFDKTRALRKELNLTTDKHVTKEEWAGINAEFLESHQYFTDYCRERLEPRKQENLRQLKKKFNIKEVTIIPKEALPVTRTNPDKDPAQRKEEVARKEDDKKDKKAKPERPERPERGIETMFRTTASNHLKLSEMADSKAHIMISVNSIILSIVISVLLQKLEYYSNFIIPTALLIVMCVLAIIFSVLATRPNVMSGRFTKEDIQNKKPNLLFFGNFHRMSLDDYNWGMNELMNDRTYLYGSMIKDIYFLGVVLARKYKYLRISYNIFMYGLVIAVVAFVIACFFIPTSA